jgi:hypothetical protein
MAWRKWLVRGFVFTILAGAVLAALAYQHWTSADAVRAQVLAKLRSMFPGASIALDSAGLRLFGGIQVHELRLARGSGRDKHELVHIPSAVLYHDKEKILEGEMALRKIVLPRPVLRIVRDAAGQWNVHGLLAPSDLSRPLPTLVVHEGTVHFEDRRDPARLLNLKLHDVHLTLINDPLPTVTLDGAGQSELVGKVQFRAVWQRATGELTFALKSADVPLDNALIERLAATFPVAEQLGGVQVEGVAGLSIHGSHHPGAEPARTFNVQVRLARTKVQHPSLPLPLEDLDAELTYTGTELRLEKLTARAGSAVVSASGAARMPQLDQDFYAAVTVEHLELDEALAARLPEQARACYALYEPRGRATVRLRCARRDGAWVALAGEESAVTLLPEKASARFARFPYPLHELTGTLEFGLANQRLNVDLSGRAGGRPLTIRGHWEGHGIKAEGQFDIVAADVALSPELIAALNEPARRYVEAFHATGLVDVKAQLIKKPGITAIDYDYAIHVHDGALRWQPFPFPLAHVSGDIRVTPEHWEFRNFQGRHEGGTVTLSGKSLVGSPAGERGIFIEIIGKDVPLDATLQQALWTMPALDKAWRTFQPTGRLSFTAGIERRGPSPEDLDVRVEVKGASLRPYFFPYALHDVAGSFHFHDLRLDLSKLSGRHSDARFYLERGNVEMHPHGALYVVLPELQALNFRLDQDLVAALPERLRNVAASLNCNDPLRLKTKLIIAQAGTVGSLPDVFWEGQVWLHDAAITTGIELKHVTGTIACVGRHNGIQLTGLDGNIVLERVAAFNQPFRNVTSHFQVHEKQPELLKLDLRAPIYGGDVTGQVTLDFHEKPRFDLNLTASQIDLEDFGRHNLANSQISGSAVARLVLSGAGGDPNTLDGHGTIDVPNGKLLNLPFLLDLIKFLGLRWPDRTMFEEAHLQFAIRGRRARVRHLALYGNAVSFTGQGEVDLDGTNLALELYPTWARIEQLLPPAIRAVPPAVSKNLLTVEAKGKLTGEPADLKFTKKPVPIIVDPLLNLRDRMLGAPMMEPRREPLTPLRLPELRAPWFGPGS